MFRRFFPSDRELDEALDQGYAHGGHQAALVRGAETLAARPGAAEVLSFLITSLYAWAGEEERTLEWLEFMHQTRNPNLVATVYAPELDFVRDDPRYQDLLRRMGLPE